MKTLILLVWTLAMFFFQSQAAAYGYAIAEWVEKQPQVLRWPTRVVDYDTGQPLEGVLVVRCVDPVEIYHVRNFTPESIVDAEFSDSNGAFDLNRTHSWISRFLRRNNLMELRSRAQVSPYKFGYMLRGIDENSKTDVTTLRMQRIRGNSNFQLENMRHILTLPYAKGTPNEISTAHFMAFFDTQRTTCMTNTAGEYLKRAFDAIPRSGPQKMPYGTPIEKMANPRIRFFGDPELEAARAQKLAECIGPPNIRKLPDGTEITYSTTIPERCQKL